MVLSSVPLVAQRAAVACSPAWPVVEPTDPAKLGTDGAPPVILDVTADLRRGTYDGADSCSDIGWLWLDIEAEDDLTAPEELRYRVQDMTQEGSVFFFDGPVPWFSVAWSDDGKMPLDFRLRVFAVDRGGNESEPFDLRVRDGDDAEDCSMTRAATAATAQMGQAAQLLLALALCSRRGQTRRARRGLSRELEHGGGRRALTSPPGSARR